MNLAGKHVWLRHGDPVPKGAIVCGTDYPQHHHRYSVMIFIPDKPKKKRRRVRK